MLFRAQDNDHINRAQMVDRASRVTEIEVLSTSQARLFVVFLEKNPY